MTISRLWKRAPTAVMKLATAARQLSDGDLAACRAGCEEILSDDPAHAGALELLGNVEMAGNSPSRAITFFERALVADPTRTSVTLRLARAHQALGDVPRALALLADICKADPHNIDAWISRAGLLADSGELPASEDVLLGCIEAGNDTAAALIALGIVRMKQSDWSGAALAFERTLSIEPESVPAARHLAFLREVVGDLAGAAQWLARALQFDDRNAEILAQAARVALRSGDPQKAIECAAEALAIDPRAADAHFQMGCGYWGLGDGARAVAAFRAAIDDDAENASARWALAMAELQEIGWGDGAARAQRFAEQIEFLQGWLTAERSRRAIDAVGSFTPFFLAYTERDNRALLSSYGDLCAAVVSSVRTARTAQQPRGPARLRVGIVSAHLYDHSVWHAIAKGWFLHFDKSRVDLYAYSLKGVVDAETRIAMQRSVRFVQLESRRVDDWVSAIAGDDLDVLIYPEIGMNGIALRLACERLAPLQVAAWGHPETTGLPTIDCYLSAEAFEPAQGGRHYREDLVALPGMGVCCSPSSVAMVEVDLQALGISAQRPVILCPGTPFKYAAQHDHLLVAIARTVPACQMVFFNDARDVFGAQLLARLEQAFADAGLTMREHVVVVPWLDAAHWQGLLHQATLMLDTVGFSGFNTAAQALAARLPIVAWDGRFMRGRLASGLLRCFDLGDWIARSEEEFVSKVTSLCNDADARRNFVARIVSNEARVFGDPAPVRALEALLLQKSAGRA